MNRGRLTGRAAIVTGGGSGMGAATARALAREGARVLVADRDGPAAEGVAGEIRARGGEALAATVDVTRQEQVRRMVETALGSFGAVDVLACFAGVLRTTPTEEIGEEEWDQVLGVNLKGVFLCAQAVLPAMRARRSGSIVIAASTAGRATSRAGGAHYTASKAGVLGLTRHLAREAAPFGVRVNAINPGIIDTPMLRAATPPERLPLLVEAIPIGRLGLPAEVAEVAVFLATDEAAYVTGAAIDVHGGFLNV